ncbi:amino acid transmembrane transporter [Scenedesmus sp. NREL 46B-D3]|nr:amino acid transmembrane transporter [Scenedesmus sp. NREL 46B-D3]
MPLTASREGHWYSSAFHNVTAMVGAGVLGLPYTFVYLGWGGGMLVMLLSLVISWYTFYELVHLHEVPHPTQPGIRPPRRLNRYHELTQHAWGVVRGSWAILPFQVAVMSGLGVTYTVTGGSSLASLARRHGHFGVSKTGCIVAFSAGQVLLSQLPSFNDLSWMSGVGALMSLVYSVIAVALSIGQATSRSQEQQPSYERGTPAESRSEFLFGVFNAVATVCFAWGGHNVALEIQATLPHPPSTVEPMMRGVNLAYLLAFACYFGVTIAGYAVFGNAVAENVLESIGQPLSLISLAEMCVVLHVAASCQVYSFPMYDMIQQGLWRRGIRLSTSASRLMRVAYVLLICFVAVLLPFFGDLMGLVGAVGVTPTTFLMPAILWLYLKRPPRSSIAFVGNVAIIVLCMLVGILGTVGSLHLIARHAAQYQLFS